MQIILLERVAKLGQMGEIVTVKDGYARNFLLPQGKALRANKTNRAYFDAQRAQLEARNLETRKEAETLLKKIDGKNYTIIRQSSEAGQLYGSVDSRAIAAQLTESGTTIDRAQIALDKPIKTLGLHPVTISLHPEVTAGVTINVARTEEEAERQLKGEDVTATQDAPEAENVKAEEMFDEGVDVTLDEPETEDSTDTETPSQDTEEPQDKETQDDSPPADSPADSEDA